MKKLWMSWSSGKDSAFALAQLFKDPRYDVAGLFTSINEQRDRVAMHSTRLTLLHKQADALGLPLEIVPLPENCSNEVYLNRMDDLIGKARDTGVTAMGFGDLFLEDIRNYRERQLAGSGIEAVFPLWHRPTQELAQDMLNSGIKAVLTCIDPSKLHDSFAGREFNLETIAQFPAGVDPCGENGEFHTFVFESPLFREKIPIVAGEKVRRGGFVYADVLPLNRLPKQK